MFSSRILPFDKPTRNMLKFIADESFDEGTHIDRILRSEKVAQDLGDE